MAISFALGGGFDPHAAADFREKAAIGDAGGLAMIMTGDSPALLGDCYVGLSLIAGATTHCRVASAITNIVTRHPTVVASAIATIDAISGGRAVLGIGTGNSGVTKLGANPSALDDLEAFVATLRALWDNGEAIWGGHPLRFAWRHRKRIPVFISAGGPKGLHLAGRIADGVFVETGLTREVVADSLTRIEDGARAAGRSIDDIEIWWYARGIFAGTRDQAIAEDNSGLAGLGVRLMRGDPAAKLVPPEIGARLSALKGAFSVKDYGERAQPLVADFGLGDYLADRFAIAGTPDDWLARAADLEAAGIRNVAILSSDPDGRGFVETLTRDVIARLA